MNVEKDELCKVWSEQKIRKEWTMEDVVSRDIFDRTTKKRWVDLEIQDEGTQYLALTDLHYNEMIN